jgi:hypothetical protein
MSGNRSNQGASRRSCDRCGAAVLRQKAGLPWTVTADDERLTPAEAEARMTPNRRSYCLRESPWTGLRLVEVMASVHRRDCTAHVVEHECPPGTPLTPKPEGALW